MTMTTVTITLKEYRRLLKAKHALEFIEAAEDDLIYSHQREFFHKVLGKEQSNETV
jgi:hypothetical protein